MSVNDHPYKNHLLITLLDHGFTDLIPHLNWSRLDYRSRIELAGQPIERVYFPETGIISVVALDQRQRHIEVGLIGYEGMSGSAIIMGDDRSPNETYVQACGDAHWIRTDELRKVLRNQPGIREVLLRYLHAFAVQLSQTALSNGRAGVSVRLARWLLMAQDRMDSPTLSLTHGLLSMILGARRPSVTDALHRLESTGSVRASRGYVTIRHRDRLELQAEGTYGIPEKEYLRLFGAMAKATP